MPNNLKGYDGFQVLRSVFDVDQNCLRVCLVDGGAGSGGAVEVIIDHTSDSIRLGDGTSLVTTTVLPNSKVGLDVNLANIEDMVTNDGVGNPITSTLTEATIAKRGLDVVSLNELVPREFNEIEITAKNAEGDPTTVIYRSNAEVVATLTIVYDIDGDLQRVTRA